MTKHARPSRQGKVQVTVWLSPDEKAQLENLFETQGHDGIKNEFLKASLLTGAKFRTNSGKGARKGVK